MSEYRAIYKCRLCGGEFETEYVNGSLLTGKFCIDMTPDKYVFHDCQKNGNKIGAGDFIGFHKVED